MMLVVDIGNTRTKAAVMRDEDIEWIAVNTEPKIDTGSILKELGIEGGLERVIISSVVNEVNGVFERFALDVSGKEGLFVDHRTKTGLGLFLNDPEDIGPDRIANAVGGWHVAGGPVAVIDMGSAITVTVVNDNAELVGGSIMPGVNLMARSLSEGTSRLPLVDPGIPEGVIGRDTRTSIMAGIGYGAAGAVERSIREIKDIIKYDIKVIMTGGTSQDLAGMISGIDIVEPLLTLKGLFLIGELNI
ncbi:MAG: type III pantothenate kinase [Nitrospirota bacterium]|nr:MAG: type III pantothenate kinase [Nitrospirota bacterium]